MRRALFHLVMFALFVPYACASILASLAARFVHFHDRLETDMEDWSEDLHKRIAEGLRMRLRAAYARERAEELSTRQRYKSTKPLPVVTKPLRYDDLIDDLPDRKDEL